MKSDCFEDQLVSIITPVYNKARFLSQTIESVLCQSYTYWELILVDDASTDASFEIIRRYADADARIRVKRLESNMGAGAARNEALAMARGRYVAFLDADDLWKADKLSKQMDFMKKNGCCFAYTAIEMIDEDGRTVKGKRRTCPRVDYRRLLSDTVIACSSVLIDRSITGNFMMPPMRKGQDYATWLALLRGGLEAYGLDEALVRYRISAGAVSSNKLDALRRTWRVYRRQEHLNPLESAFYFVQYLFHAVVKYLF